MAKRKLSAKARHNISKDMRAARERKKINLETNHPGNLPNDTLSHSDPETEDRRKAPRNVNEFENELAKVRREARIEGEKLGWQRAGKHYESLLDIQKNNRASENACLSIAGEDVRIRSMSDNDMRSYFNDRADLYASLDAERNIIERKLTLVKRECDELLNEMRFRGMQVSSVDEVLRNENSNLVESSWNTASETDRNSDRLSKLTTSR